MKKILSIALAAAMVMGSCAFAAVNQDQPWDQTTPVSEPTVKLSYKQGVTWKVTIPTGELKEDGESTHDLVLGEKTIIGKVAVTEKKLDPKGQVTVKVTSANDASGYKLKVNASTETAQYNLYSGTVNDAEQCSTPVAGNTAFLKANATGADSDTYLAYEIPAANLTVAGTWEDTLTFGVAYDANGNAGE